MLAAASLHMRMGTGMSVILHDNARTEIRIRKWPTDNFGDRVREVRESPDVLVSPETGEPGEAGLQAQLRLDEHDKEWLFGEPYNGEDYDLFVLWWADKAQESLAGAALCAVVEIDDPKLVKILAAQPLSAAVLPQQKALRPPERSRRAGHFEEHDEARDITGTTDSGEPPA